MRFALLVILAGSNIFAQSFYGTLRGRVVDSAGAAAVAANPTKERWEVAFQVVEQAVARGSADVAAVAARSLARCMPPGVDALPQAVGSLAPVMDRAGLLRRRRG